jgi:hypothetical protein
MTDPHQHPPPKDSPPPEIGTQEKGDKVDDQATRSDQTVRQNAPGVQESSNLAQLTSRRDQLGKQHQKILDELLGLRQKAKETSLVAQSTRTPIPQTTIDHWKSGIRSAQGRLEVLQREIGEVNKTIRALHAKESASRWNGNVPRGADRRAKGISNPPLRADGVPPSDDEEDLFLSCFHRIASDSLDPRLLAALERDALALTADHRRMNKGGH